MKDGKSRFMMIREADGQNLDLLPSACIYLVAIVIIITMMMTMTVMMMMIIIVIYVYI